MPTIRDIKGRIRSVTTTKKTTKAMNLVSSSKLARAKARLTAGNPFFEQMRQVISNIIKAGGIEDHAFFSSQPTKKSLIVVIANDRGLCGGYNTNICKHAANLKSELEADGKEVSIYAIGNKARDFFRRSGANIIESVNGISESPFFEDGLEIASKISAQFENEDFGEVFVCYTQFVSAISYVPDTLKLLPLSIEDFLKEGEPGGIMKYEPDAQSVLKVVVPKYVSAMVFEALVTSASSGQAATMTAMDAATENAENIIDNLTLMKNRARQAVITQEISEIVGGANALK